MAGVVTALVCVELAARLARPELPAWRPEGEGMVLTAHPTLIWGMSPGVKLNAGAMATIGSTGLRDEPGDPGAILVLGDSALFGHGVEDDETLPAQLEALMGVEVINAAVPGYSIEQALLWMEDQGWGLSPSLVLAGCLWSGNAWGAWTDEELLRTRRLGRWNPLVHSGALKLLVAWAAPKGSVVAWTPTLDWPEDKVRRVPLKRWAELNDALAHQAADRGVGLVFLQPTNDVLLTGDRPLQWAVYLDAMEALAAHHDVPLVALSDALAPDQLLDRMHPTAEGHTAGALAVQAALQGWPEQLHLPSGGVFDTSSLVDEAPLGWRDGTDPQRSLFSE